MAPRVAPTPDPFWIDQYARKAESTDPLAQTGRGDSTDLVEFLRLVRYVLGRLRPGPEHDVLDLGAANGLMSLVLSGSCKSVLAVEPVPGLVTHAKENLALCENARVEQGHSTEIPAPDQAFDRSLVWGVLQLVPPEEVAESFCELKRVSRPGAKLLIGSIPDAAARDQFLIRYMEGVRAASHLSPEQKKEIEQRNLAATWHDVDTLYTLWRDLGCGVSVSRVTVGDADERYRFNLEVALPSQ